jgi:hypothetical protein
MSSPTTTKQRPNLKMSKETIKEMLQTCGYVIIQNVLTQEQIAHAKQLMIEWEKSMTDLQEKHSDINPHGIYKFHEAGHAPHSWYIRTLPKVQQVFKDIWDTDDLITGFDGSCFMPKDLKKKDTKQGWTHADQSPNMSGKLLCYQSIVALTTNQERTLVVYEGSNNLYQKYCLERQLKGTKHWQKIDPEYLKTIADKRKALRVPAGAIAIWDSRTFHQNQYGKPNSEERRVQYICFLPRSHPSNTAAVAKKRKERFEERRTTSHWPAPIYVNGLQPNTWGDDSKKIDYSKVKRTDLSALMPEIEKII